MRNPIDAVLARGRRVRRGIGDAVLRVRDPLIPPRRLMFDGPKDRRAFRENGKEFLRYYVDMCGLEPDGSVLDVGSGMGRKTVPLTRYLSPHGRYEGIEIARAGVDWCSRNITSRFPNFRFTWLDIRNEPFNPKGEVEPTDVRFPFTDAQFDLVVLGSVFTHVPEQVVRHYLGEIARVLKPGGRSLITYFVLNSDAKSHIAGGFADFTFAYQRGRSWIENRDNPGVAIAYEEEYLRDVYAQNGFEILEPIRMGVWCGRRARWGNEYGTYQDIVIAAKRVAGSGGRSR